MERSGSRSRLMTTTVLAGVVALAAGHAAFAQSTTASSTTATDNKTVEAITVTGSRIKRSDFTSADPITVVTSDQAKLQGIASVGELLQQQAIAVSTFQTNTELTGYVVVGGPGAKTLSLRGLGAQRTLILIDGRRVGPAGTRGQVGPVDLTTVPESIIDRVEVLKDGASSLYGSDAVGGVLNIITRRNTKGGEFQVNATDSEHGGGNNYLVSGTYGQRFDRGYFNVAAEYFSQEPLRVRDRAYLNCSDDYLFDPTTGKRVDFGAVGPNEGHPYKCYNAVQNVILTQFVAPNAINGRPQAYQLYVQYRNPSVTYPTAAQGNNTPATIAGQFAIQARAGFPATYPYGNFTSPTYDQISALSPEKHYSAFFNGGYDLTPDVQLYTQVQFNQRVSEQEGARQFFPSLSSTYRAANPNNIFFGTGVTPIYPVIALPSNNYQTVNYTRAVVGAKGKFRDLGWFDRFNFDVFASYTQSNAHYKQDIIYADRVNATTTFATGCSPNGVSNTGAVNVSNYNCSDLPASGIPYLSQRILQGGFTPQESAFLFGREGGHTIYDQWYVDGSITGDLLQVPAGTVSIALGGQWRTESIDDNPDRDLAQNNLWGQTSAGRTKGTDSVKELYGELYIPILKNLTGVKSLDLDISGRTSTYDSYGSNHTYKANLNWQIIPDIRLRGTIGTSFRAPALYEQFLANQTAFTGQTNIDPCINYAASTNATLQKNCAAAGIAPNYTGAGPSALVITGGGRGVLSAETSTTKTVGIVLTPKFISQWADVNVAVDYYQAEIHNEVAQFGAGNILNQCYTRPDYPNNPYCKLFTRDTDPTSPTYQNVLTVNNSYLNLANQIARGISATINISHNFGERWGRASFYGSAEWRLKNTTQILKSVAPTDYLGTTYNYGGPDFSANTAVSWERGPILVTLTSLFIGKGSDTEVFGQDVYNSTRYADIPNGVCPVVNGAGTSTASCATPVYYKQYNNFRGYHDLSVRYRFLKHDADVIFGVRNLFDEPPPKSSTGQFRRGEADLNVYDLIGRRYFVNITKRFQ